MGARRAAPFGCSAVAIGRRSCHAVCSTGIAFPCAPELDPARSAGITPPSGSTRSSDFCRAIDRRSFVLRPTSHRAGTRQISQGKTLRFRRDHVANTPSGPTETGHRCWRPAHPPKGRLTALHSRSRRRHTYGFLQTRPHGSSAAQPGRTEAARSIPDRALASSISGSPCQGPGSGLPPPISNVMPGTPLRPTASAPRRQRAGENRWPPVGRQRDHRWGEPMAVPGEKPMAVDTASARRAWCGRDGSASCVEVEVMATDPAREQPRDPAPTDRRVSALGRLDPSRMSEPRHQDRGRPRTPRRPSPRPRRQAHWTNCLLQTNSLALTTEEPRARKLAPTDLHPRRPPPPPSPTHRLPHADLSRLPRSRHPAPDRPRPTPPAGPSTTSEARLRGADRPAGRRHHASDARSRAGHRRARIPSW